MITKEIVVLAMAIGYTVFLFILGGVGKWVKLKEKTITEFFRPTGIAPAWMLWFAMGANMHTAFAIPGSMGFYYAHGVGFTMHWVWTLTTPLFVMYVLGPRLRAIAQKYGYVTISEMLGDFYESPALAVFIAIFLSVANMAYFTANVIGPALMLSYGTGYLVPYEWAIFIILLTIMGYCFAGGFKSVFYTDVLQGALMLVATWGAAFFMLSLFNWNTWALFSKVYEISPKHMTIPGALGLITPAWWFSFSFAPHVFHWAIQPRNFTYYQLAKSNEEVRRNALLMGLYLSMIYVPVVILGLGVKALMPEPPKAGFWVGPDAAFPTFMAANAPAVLWGVLVAGSMAAGQSTMDSDLVSHSGMLVRDVYMRLIKKDASPEHYFRVGRLIVLIFGLVTVYISTYAAKLPIITLLTPLSTGVVGCLFLPVLGAVCPMGRFKVTKAGAWAALIVGIIVNLVTMTPNFVGSPKWLQNPGGFHFTLAVNLAAIVAGVVVSLFTKPPSREKLEKFHLFLAQEFAKPA